MDFSDLFLAEVSSSPVEPFGPIDEEEPVLLTGENQMVDDHLLDFLNDDSNLLLPAVAFQQIFQHSDAEDETADDPDLTADETFPADSPPAATSEAEVDVVVVVATLDLNEVMIKAKLDEDMRQRIAAVSDG
jgi:hypothetical protein